MCTCSSLMRQIHTLCLQTSGCENSVGKNAEGPPPLHCSLSLNQAPVLQVKQVPTGNLEQLSDCKRHMVTTS